jgi:hypothetical protein
MPGSVTVWVVPLGRGSSMEGEKGALAIVDECLQFTPADDPVAVRRWSLADVTRARRLRGSPVLLVETETAHGAERVAFYFVQPPPLRPSDDEPLRPSLGGFGRPTKRRVRRRNVTYLGMANRDLRDLLREWEVRVRAAADAAKSV